MCVCVYFWRSFNSRRNILIEWARETLAIWFWFCLPQKYVAIARMKHLCRRPNHANAHTSTFQWYFAPDGDAFGKLVVFISRASLMTGHWMFGLDGEVKCPAIRLRSNRSHTTFSFLLMRGNFLPFRCSNAMSTSFACWPLFEPKPRSNVVNPLSYGWMTDRQRTSIRFIRNFKRISMREKKINNCRYDTRLSNLI